MSWLKVLTCILFIGTLSACSTPEEDAARARKDVDRQRLELVDKYQECIKDADGDSAKADACETYLKAADALN